MDQLKTTVYTVYILRTAKNTLYTGITNDIKSRLKVHAAKNAKSSKYMRSFSSFTLVYTEECKTKSEALKREIEIKKLTKEKKEQLITHSF